MTYVTLTNKELEEANLFLAGKARKLLRDGGQYALVFSHSSGIGRTATITVKSKSGEILSRDITDYTIW